jgi:hypothetical protein
LTIYYLLLCLLVSSSLCPAGHRPKGSAAHTRRVKAKSKKPIYDYEVVYEKQTLTPLVCEAFLLRGGCLSLAPKGLRERKRPSTEGLTKQPLSPLREEAKRLVKQPLSPSSPLWPAPASLSQSFCPVSLCTPSFPILKRLTENRWAKQPPVSPAPFGGSGGLRGRVSTRQAVSLTARRAPKE